MFLAVSFNIFGQSDTISLDEREMINQINVLRANPKSYIQYVQQYISEQKEVIKKEDLAIKSYKDVNNSSVSISNTTTTTVTFNITYKHVNENTKIREDIIRMANDNIKLANELILVLNTTPSVPELTLDLKMYEVSKSHLNVLKTEDKLCHECASDGTLDKRMRHLYLSFGENLVSNEGVVKSLVKLLLDADDINRGHRKTLLSVGKDRKWRFVSVAISNEIVVQNFGY